MVNKVCVDIRNKFSDYIDELLSESEMSGLEMHIKKCASCTKELEAFNKTIQAVRNLPRYTTHMSIIVKINDRIEKNKKWWEKLNTKAFRVSLGVLSAVTICVIGFQFYNDSGITGIFRSREMPGKPAAADKEVPGNSINNPVKKAINNTRSSVAAEAVERSEASGKPEPGRKTVTSKAVEEQTNQEAAGQEEMKSKAQHFTGSAEDLKLQNGMSAVPFKSLAIYNAFEQKGLFCANSIKENMVIKDETALKKLWKKSFADLPEPVIDFKKDMLIAVFLGEQAADPKDISIKEITREGNNIKVKIGLTDILNTDTSGKSLSPYHMKAIRKSNLNVEFSAE